MRSFLIHENLASITGLKRESVGGGAFLVANSIEKVILIFGKEQIEERKW
jgi:hypothetical protein